MICSLLITTPLNWNQVETTPITKLQLLPKCTDSSKIKQSKHYLLSRICRWVREKKAAVVSSNRDKPAVSIEGTSKVSRNSRKKHLVLGRERRRRRRLFRRRCEGYVELEGGGNSKSREAQTHFPRKRYCWHRLRNKNAVVCVWLCLCLVIIM